MQNLSIWIQLQALCKESSLKVCTPALHWVLWNDKQQPEIQDERCSACLGHQEFHFASDQTESPHFWMCTFPGLAFYPHARLPHTDAHLQNDRHQSHASCRQNILQHMYPHFWIIRNQMSRHGSKNTSFRWLIQQYGYLEQLIRL